MQFSTLNEYATFLYEFTRKRRIPCRARTYDMDEQARAEQRSQPNGGEGTPLR